MMTTMRYRDIAARGRDEHSRDQDANRRMARIVLARRRLPELQTAAVSNDPRAVGAKPPATRMSRAARRARPAL
jgi:hypothetical protein